MLAFVKGLWAFKELIIVAVLLATVSGYIWNHNRVVAKLERVELELENTQEQYKLSKIAWGKEVKKWDEQVARQKQELEDTRKEKDAVVQRNFSMFKESKKRVEDNKKETNEKIEKAAKPDDVVVAPAWVRRVYDSAIEGSRIATSNQRERAASLDFTGTSSETETFDAVALTQVLVANADAYSVLAVQCNKLIDTVMELEAIDERNDAGGPESKTSSVGGDISDGALAGDIR